MQLMDWNPSQTLDEAFIRLPFDIYQKDNFWLGENSAAVRLAFSDRNDFFKSGKSWVGNTDKCRLAGFIEADNVIEGKKAAYFGYWETYNDVKDNRYLFSQFEQWAKKQGADIVYGPINFNTYGSNRLRVDAFDQPAFIGEPYNPDYYPVLLRKMGYQICYRYQSRFHRDPPQWAQEMDALYQKQKLVLGNQFQIKALTPDIWLQRLDELYEVIDVAFRSNFAYRPISKLQFINGFGKGYINKACPKTSNIVFDENNRVVGFFVAFPDYAPLLQLRENRSGEVTTDYQTCYRDLVEPRLLLAKTGAVHPDYRTSGVFTWMANEILMNSLGRYEHICSAMIREDNHSLGYAMRCPIQRTYGLFSKNI